MIKSKENERTSSQVFFLIQHLMKQGCHQFAIISSTKENNSQAFTNGTESRVYTPEQMQKIYDESTSKLKNSYNLNNSVTNKNKKVKRGVKTSYGNYTQHHVPMNFNAKFNMHKARKSLMTTGNTNSKKTILIKNAKNSFMDSFK